MQITKHVIKNHLIPKSHSALGSTTRGYAVRSVNKPDKAVQKGSLADTNNPCTNKGRHYEVHRQECNTNNDCKEKDCTAL